MEKEQGRRVMRKVTGSGVPARGQARRGAVLWQGETGRRHPREAPAAAGTSGWPSAPSLPPHRCGRSVAGSPGQPLSWDLEVDGA